MERDKEFRFSQNELRCGNSINYINENGDIVFVVVDAGDVKKLQDDPDGFNICYSPIPFTEPNFVKLGFKLEEEDPKRWVLSKDSRIDIVLKDSVLDVRYNSVPLYDVVRYIHDIQNFYYLLKGEMLIIKT